MDLQSLVVKLKQIFSLYHQKDGLVVDGFGFAPAYGGMVKDSYIFGVSAPSLDDRDCYQKTDYIIDILFENLNESERKMIDAVSVYNSYSDLILHSKSDFDDSVCYDPVKVKTKVFAMAD